MGDLQIFLQKQVLDDATKELQEKLAKVEQTLADMTEERDNYASSYSKEVGLRQQIEGERAEMKVDFTHTRISAQILRRIATTLANELFERRNCGRAEEEDAIKALREYADVVAGMSYEDWKKGIE